MVNVLKPVFVCISVKKCPVVMTQAGSVLEYDDVTYGSVMTVTCSPAHSFIDGSTARSYTCTAQGQWNDAMQDNIQLCQGQMCVRSTE